MNWVILRDTLTSRGNKARRKEQNWEPDLSWGEFPSAEAAKLAFMRGTDYTLKDKPDASVIALFDKQANSRSPLALVSRKG